MITLRLEPDLGGRYRDERELIETLLDTFGYVSLSRREGREAVKALAADLRRRGLPRAVVDAAAGLGPHSFGFVAQDAPGADRFLLGTFVPGRTIPLRLPDERARPLARRLARALAYRLGTA